MDSEFPPNVVRSGPGGPCKPDHASAFSPPLHKNLRIWSMQQLKELSGLGLHSGPFEVSLDLITRTEDNRYYLDKRTDCKKKRDTTTARHPTPGMAAKGAIRWSSSRADVPSKAMALVFSTSCSNSLKASTALDMRATRAHAA